MKRLKNMIKILITLAVSCSLVSLIIKSSFAISENLGIVCMVGIVLLGAWIVAED